MSGQAPERPPTEAEARYSRFLDKYRAEADADEDYEGSEVCRRDMTEGYQRASGGLTPYGWQLDVAEALMLGLDTTVIAGTGAGKTTPFILPLFIKDHEKSMVLIISPLKDLQSDQVRRFNALGLPAIALNQDTWSETVSKDLLARRFRVLLAGPEMCLRHGGLSTLLRRPSFTQHILYLVVDEAHCIDQWGNSGFRDDWAGLQKLRSSFDDGTATLACSATMSSSTLEKVRQSLGIREDDSYHLNLGNQRPNITELVLPMERGAKPFSALEFIVKDAEEGQSLPHTIVFVRTRDEAYQAAAYLRSLLPESLRRQIDFITSLRSSIDRKNVSQAFDECRVNILCATDCAGMGKDDPRVVCVINYGTPRSALDAKQYAGRSGRQGQASRYVTLVEWTAIHAIEPKCSDAKATKKTKKTKKGTKRKRSKTGSTEDPALEEGEEAPAVDILLSDHEEIIDVDALDEKGPADVKYMKQLDPVLRSIYLSSGCRHEPMDSFFANPPPRHARTTPCCDNCVRAQLGLPDATFHEVWSVLNQHVPLGAPSHQVLTILPLTAARDVQDQRVTSALPPRVKPEEKDSMIPPARSPDQRAVRKKALTNWALECWRQSYKYSGMSPQVVLSDRQINILASTVFETLDDLREHPVIKRWHFLDNHAQSVLALLGPLDEADRRAQANQIAEEQEKKRQKQEDQEERKRQKAEDMQQRIEAARQELLRKEEEQARSKAEKERRKQEKKAQSQLRKRGAKP